MHNFHKEFAGLTMVLSVVIAFSAIGCGKGTILSTKDEVRIGAGAARDVEAKYTVETNTTDSRRVQRIGERLLAHTDQREGIFYTFKLIEDKEVNAVSLPGGHIYVFKGLMKLIGDDDDALATVIGHEIGHVNARHIAKQYTKQVEAGLIVNILLAKSGNLAQQVGGLGLDILSFKFSRDDEYEADRRGLSYTYKAGFDPRGMVRFFTKLQAQDKVKTPELLRSHPVTSSRIDRAQKIIETQEYRYGQ